MVEEQEAVDLPENKQPEHPPEEEPRCLQAVRLLRHAIEDDHVGNEICGVAQKFEAMLDRPETELLGLRGLFLEAGRRGHEFLFA